MGGGQRRTSASDINNSTSVWRIIAMIKCTVASARMVLNMEENRTFTAPKLAEKIIMLNAEMSDMAHRERLTVATSKLNNPPNTTEIACRVIWR